ncbi:MAG: thioredoxin family protein [Candidatus Eremiobacterota bacterium]
MNNKVILKIVVILLVLGGFGAIYFLKKENKPAETQVVANQEEKFPALVDYGSEGCKPCKEMVPVLETLKKEYEGKVRIDFIDVEVMANRDKVVKAGIKLIPTQIIYDSEGKEVFRHEGFIPKEDVDKIFKEKGLIK